MLTIELSDSERLVPSKRIPLGSQMCRKCWIMLVFRICGALCVLLSPFLFRGSEVCFFYIHFGYFVYSSTAFNLCVADIHILYFKNISIVQLRRNCAFIYTPVFFFSYMCHSLFLQFHYHKVDWIDQLFSS